MELKFKKGFHVDKHDGEIKQGEFILIDNLRVSYSDYEKSYLFKTEDGIVLLAEYRIWMFEDKKSAIERSEMIKKELLEYLINQRKGYDDRIKKLQIKQK